VSRLGRPRSKQRKTCPKCFESIHTKAVVCPHCGSQLSPIRERLHIGICITIGLLLLFGIRHFGSFLLLSVSRTLTLVLTTVLLSTSYVFIGICVGLRVSRHRFGALILVAFAVTFLEELIWPTPSDLGTITLILILTFIWVLTSLRFGAGIGNRLGRRFAIQPVPPDRIQDYIVWGAATIGSGIIQVFIKELIGGVK
jgi:hypothetical protein